MAVFFFCLVGIANFLFLVKIFYIRCQVFLETWISSSIQVTLVGKSKSSMFFFLFPVTSFLKNRGFVTLYVACSVMLLWSVAYLVGRFQRAKPIIIDPGLYMTKKSDVFWVSERRSVPTAFKLFTGAYFLLSLSTFLLFIDPSIFRQSCWCYFFIQCPAIGCWL